VPFYPMNHFKTTVLPFLLLLLSLQGSAQETTFPENVGEIPFDSLQDDPHFTICNEKQVFQYYNTNSYYKDHKNEIIKYLLGQYEAEDNFGDQNVSWVSMKRRTILEIRMDISPSSSLSIVKERPAVFAFSR